MWVEPKTNWKQDDFFNVGDYNRIKGNLNEIRQQALSLTQNDTRRIGVTKSSINFSGYKYLKMNVYGQKNHYGVTSVGAKFLDNPSDDAGEQPGGVSELPDKTWTLVTIPLANVQKWAYLRVSFSTIRGSTSAETTVDSKINEIYLSKY